jgi:hypothetical protein
MWLCVPFVGRVCLSFLEGGEAFAETLASTVDLVAGRSSLRRRVL